MQLTNYLALFAGILSSVSATEDVNSSIEARDLECVRGAHVVGLGGQGTTNGNLGYLQPLADSIVNGIPHSNLHTIGYPPGATGATVIAYAVPKLRKHIHAYSAKCPKTKIILVSYSLGGSATMDTLCGAAATGAHPLAKKYKHHIIANLVYGDLGFIPKLSYDRGTCKAKTGLVPRRYPGKCFPYGRVTHSWCDHGDVNCCSGHNQAVHFEYPQKYDQIALKYALNRWAHYKRHHKHT